MHWTSEAGPDHAGTWAPVRMTGSTPRAAAGWARTCRVGSPKATSATATTVALQGVHREIRKFLPSYSRTLATCLTARAAVPDGAPGCIVRGHPPAAHRGVSCKTGMG